MSEATSSENVPRATALVVDDEPANRDFLVRLLQQACLDVHGAGSAQEALHAAEGIERLTLIVIDNKLPDMDGIDLLIALRKRYAQSHIVMATMLDERAVMDRAFENGCDVFLVKPHGFMELYHRVQTMCKERPAGSDEKVDSLQRLVIDQYGPRPFRG